MQFRYYTRLSVGWLRCCKEPSKIAAGVGLKSRRILNLALTEKHQTSLGVPAKIREGGSHWEALLATFALPDIAQSAQMLQLL